MKILETIKNKTKSIVKTVKTEITEHPVEMVLLTVAAGASAYCAATSVKDGSTLGLRFLNNGDTNGEETVESVDEDNAVEE